MLFIISLLTSQLAWGLPSPMATFSESYKSQNRGTWAVETPEVFELINVIISITPAGIAGEMLELHNILQKSDPDLGIVFGLRQRELFSSGL
jgi:hypothetical protein